MATTHQYKALDEEGTEIRLLYLLSLVEGTEYGYTEQCIRGRFEYTKIHGESDAKERIPYRALSYVWGAPKYTSAIVLEDGTQIRISHNLLLALKHVFWHGYAPGATPIWVDAVCIDQSNNEEKSWQVERMGSIYARATNTLIFLGQARNEAEAKGLERVIPILGRLGAMAADWKILGDERDEPVFRMYASVLRWMADLSPKPGMSPHEFMVRQVAMDLVSLRELGVGLLSFDCILDRPWWSRIWVLQELFMSPRPIFIIDSCTIPARGLLIALRIFIQIMQELDFEDTPDMTPEQRIAAFSKLYYIQKLPHMALQARYLRPRESPDDKAEPISTDLSWILELLQESTTLNATDPRDYVYGILGFVTYGKTLSVRIRPHYSKPVLQVYLDVASSLLLSDCNDLLRMAVLQQERMEGLPSWLPDFSARRKYGRTRPDAEESAFSYTLHTEQAHPTLELKGHVYGEIVSFDTIVSETHEKGRYGDLAEHATDEDIDVFFAKVVDVILQHPRSDQESESSVAAVTLAMQRYMASVDVVTDQREDRFTAIEALLRRQVQHATTVPTPQTKCPPRPNINVDNLPRASEATREYRELQSSEKATRVAAIDERVACIRMMGEGSLFLRDGKWGAASNKIRTGDVIVRLEIDPSLLYVLRPKGDDRFEVVSLAAVPEMEILEEKMEKEWPISIQLV